MDKEWLSSLQWKVPITKNFYSVQLESWEDKIIWDDDAVVPSRDVEMTGYESRTHGLLFYNIFYFSTKR